MALNCDFDGFLHLLEVEIYQIDKIESSIKWQKWHFRISRFSIIENISTMCEKKPHSFMEMLISLKIREDFLAW